ncbi:MAG: endolytic transglycosylase MltG [Tannerellaceae bacterium]|nr:endolytic transglycosylase MltG [Tannerellaceae bacterium]MCD8264020.1 endolytic transglycosylase MltG [Tannerellaceae bacterium]
MEKKQKKKLTVILAVLAVLLLVGAGFAWWGYNLLYKPNFHPGKPVYVYIDRQKDFPTLVRQLGDTAKISDINGFLKVAKWMKYPENIRSGRYEVTEGMNNYELVSRLRRGQQTATRITFNNIRFKDDLAQRLSDQLMLSKEDILQRIDNPVYCDSLGFTTETITAMFIPNTYEVYWTITPDGLLQRMKREYDAFWTPERKEKAQSIGLTPVQVVVLASIVEEETAAPEEYPVVAGLYINRLHRNIPLQADPTVKFAVGDFSLQRILFQHLEIESPYNTYKYAGLPPGPLRVPSIRSMESVLNYTRHNYLYMCAKEDFSGRHNFATTLAEHNRNANHYRAELNRRKIR